MGEAILVDSGDTDTGVSARNDANILFLSHNLLMGGTLDDGCDEPATMAVAAAAATTAVADAAAAAARSSADSA